MGSVSHIFSTLPSGVKVPPTPFRIDVSDSDLSQLRSLIQHAVIPPEQFYNKHANAETGKFGITREWLVNARDYWLNKYDWRVQEAFINSFPQYKQTVVGPTSNQTFDLHFAALFSRREDAIPVIFMHGWPGSFLEFIPMLDILRSRYTPETLPYHVIVPSIPDYGFSTRPHDSSLEELTTEFAAEAMNELMLSLGFDENTGYVAQGGDVGYALARTMANNFPACKTSHLNMFMFTPEQFAACQEEPLSEREERLMAGTTAWIKQGSAYAYEHGTRPSTIALTLMSNPVSMLAWMGEKFIEWSDNRPQGSEPLSLDKILNGVSLYWFSGVSVGQCGLIAAWCRRLAPRLLYRRIRPLKSRLGMRLSRWRLARCPGRGGRSCLGREWCGIRNMRLVDTLLRCRSRGRFWMIWRGFWSLLRARWGLLGVEREVVRRVTEFGIEGRWCVMR
ncbi:unnamed protein product [Sordaria macrospora k-hell]|uniref:WGS project CABT00000000 data, contig 2.20 n=1 Tax=Sordaria macrospora (strain ATCC MYA-333 / DSM 997 / K(L3346) / K-hell) TaxID=771870 RepID=F7W1S7_SORMK|nr:uncharacterized protein SMAC_04550 [Sordaria macrospora k-hell]CCC11562.1 unnamed protein product [Sordaria macrospora k-hell]